MQSFEVAHITLAEARKALRLDARKSASDIHAILDKRGMGAQADLDAAMTRERFEHSVDASWHAVALKNAPDMYDVRGIVYQGSSVVEALEFMWLAN